MYKCLVSIKWLNQDSSNQRWHDYFQLVTYHGCVEGKELAKLKLAIIEHEFVNDVPPVTIMSNVSWSIVDDIYADLGQIFMSTRQRHILPLDYASDKVKSGSLSGEFSFVFCLCFTCLVFILYHLTRKRRRRQLGRPTNVISHQHVY